MKFPYRLALLGVVAALATGCSSMGGFESKSESVLSGDKVFKNPLACAAAGALVAGGVGAVENKEAMAIGAVAGGLLGWWACDQQPKPLPDADGDGVPDKVDVCADTPSGVKVDKNGCPVDNDTDLDGVPDSRDKCPATVKGATVDESGCVPTADADHDGVPDINDLCPNTLAGATVMPNGCEMDSDNDGIPDSRDRCSGTPAGVKVGSDGCAIDSDGDGVSDILDRCPDTRPGAKVDAAGCEMGAASSGATMPEDKSMPAEPMPETGSMTSGKAESMPAPGGPGLVLKDVTFESGSATLRRSSLASLNGLADQLKETGVHVEISGHTDSTGSAALNKALSQRRAEVVMNYLVSKGVSADQLAAKGMGSEAPIADNGTAAGRAKNRRVEMRVIDQH